MANDGKRCHIICMILNANYCFLVVKHSSHNRLVAGSSPAGATKFYLLNQHIEASFKGGFFVYPSNPPSLFLSSYKNLKFFC